MTVLEAAQSDDEVATLVAMRDKLAAAMDDADQNMIPQIAGRLEAVLRRIAELRPAGRLTIDDAVAARRALRAAGTEPVAPAKRSRQSAS